MKKAFDQTVRDIKREVNKKVLKVPSIEQKVLDSTSNEPWGPHGTLLADIAQASRNYHEYQMIMSVIWKRINDTGKNWRHVYKALTVLEYLVAHGSERVIDEIREHAYQIQTLSDFQYIDSSGRDQGSNVRKKSQSLVVLVNDKDRIQEARQKAAANRDKYRNTSSGGMYRPGSYSNAGGYGERYDDDRYDGRYGNRDEERNGYGREREWGSRDDDRYGRYGDSYGRDGDRYSRDEDRYSRDGYRDDDYRGRSRSVDDYQYGSRSRSSDRDRDHAYEDDGQYSSRGSGARADDQSQDGSYGGRHLERKYSEQNLSVPPSYEEAVSVGRSPTYSDRDGEIPSAAAPKSSSPPASVTLNQPTNNLPPQPPPASPPPPPSVADQKQDDGFDEFDPRGSFSAAAPTTSNVAAPTTSNVTAPTASGGAELDLLGSLSDSFSANSLALVPTTPFAAATEDVHVNLGSVAPTSASSVSNQAFDDPFGDGPFKAIASSDDLPPQPQNVAPTFATTTNQSTEQPQFVPEKTQPINNFGDSFPVGSNMQYSPQELSTANQDIDILADILPPTGPQPVANPETLHTTPTGQPPFTAGFPPQISQTAAQVGFPLQTGPTVSQTNFQAQPGQVASLRSYPAQPSMQSGFPVQSGQLVPQSNFLAQTPQSGQPAPVAGFPSQMGSSPQAAFLAQPGQQNPNSYGNHNPQLGSASPVATQMSTQPNSMNFLSQPGSAVPVSSQMSSQSPQFQSSTSLVSQPVLSASTGSAAAAPQPAKDKFETKSTVWADTLSRGLVNLNISGPKTNPLADIGVDFEAINRKEKRMEKPTTSPAVSNINMGKAMGSGSGIGRAGAGALRPPPNPMMGSGMGMGMGMGGGPGPGIGMGGYGSVNQPVGGGMGMNMSMGMNVGMGQGGQMQRPMGFAPGANVPGGYNPMMGMGSYGQQPYGGGYR